MLYEKAPITFKVFLGGKNSAQGAQFKVALATYYYSDNVCGEYIDVEFVRKERWSVEDLTNWLADGDIYVLLSHPAQGISDSLAWDLDKMGATLHAGLIGKVGYPNREALLCPVFLQDKYRYLEACKSICNPSLKIIRTPGGHLDVATRQEIFRLYNNLILFDCLILTGLYRQIL